MRVIVSALVALALAGPVAAAARENRGNRDNDAAELRRITQSLLDTIAPGNPQLFAVYLDPALIHVDENNVVRDKKAFLADIKPLPAGIVGTSRVEEFKATFSGDLAFTTYADQEQVDFYGQRLHTRFRISDTWHRTPGGWRLLGEQIAAVLGDPPAVSLSTESLCGYAGTYRLSPDISATIKCDGDHLVAERSGRPATIYRPEVRDLFFSPGKPRTRRVFLRDAAGAITGFADRREGEDAVWKRVG